MRTLEWAKLKHFRIDEFEDPERMSHAFLLKLDRAREKSRVSFRITSSYRQGSGAHSEGVGVDLAVRNSRERFEIVRALMQGQFRRIGVYDKHIHVDDSMKLDREVLWIGVSQ